MCVCVRACVLSPEYSGYGVTFTTHPLIAPRLSVGRTIGYVYCPLLEKKHLTFQASGISLTLAKEVGENIQMLSKTLVSITV